jgi:hypothetical protein
MHKRLSCVFGAVLSVCAAASAGIIHVDGEAESAGADGSPEHPYPTIQAALNAAGDNARISVAPGVYRTGETVHRNSRSRVAIFNKTGVVIESSAGKHRTFIVGAEGSGERGLGSDAVRCIIADGCTDVVVRGFTLTGGRTLASDEKGGYGGALLDVQTSWSASHAGVWLDDCIVSNCAAWCAGALYGGGAARCLLRDNSAVLSASVSHRGTFVNSVFCGNAITENNAYMLMYADAVNCTLSGNSATRAAFGGGKFYNSVCELSGAAKELETGHLDIRHSVDCTAGNAPYGPRQLVAPATGDYRLNAFSDAVGAGEAELLAEVSVPAGIDRYKDFLGGHIGRSGPIDAGAVQGAVRTAAGALRFESEADAPVYVNGVKAPAMTYVHAMTYPVQFRVVPTAPEGKRFFRFNRNGDAGGVYPNADGGYWMLPPGDPSSEITNRAVFAKAVLWVDEKNGTSSGTGAESAPFATLQQAADACTLNYTLVMVRDGVYSNGCDISTQYGNSRLATKSSCDVIFRSVNGPEKTHIVGGPSEAPFDPEGHPGCGDGAVRCVRLHTGSAVQGFTLRDGYVAANMSAPSTWKKSAGAVLGYGGSDAQVLDCVVSNTVSAQGTVYNAVSLRNRFSGNRSVVWMLGSTCRSAFSYFCRNTVVGWDYTSEGVLGCLGYNNTVWGEEGDGVRVAGSQSTSYNTILRGGHFMFSGQTLYGTIAWKYGWNYCSSPFADVDPLFLSDGSVWDCSLSAFSPARTNGLQLTSSGYGPEFADMALGDIDGRALTFSADGAPAVGASQLFLPGLTIDCGQGGLVVEGADVGDNTLSPGSEITVSAGTGPRPCIGFTLGGVTNLFAESPSVKVCADDIGPGGIAKIEALYGNEWYVAPDGDDASSGFSPDTPKATFAALMPFVAPGDTVYAAPGVYSNGVTTAEGETVGARLHVPSGCTVIAPAGAAETTILGGENIRCVYLEEQAVIRGFTLSGGRASSSSSVASDRLGGAILGGRDHGYLAGYGIEAFGCVVTNCCSPNGVVCRVRLVDSLITGCTSGDDLVRQSGLYGCLVERNVATVVFTWGQDMIGCTLAGDNVKSGGEELSNGFGSPSYGEQGASHIFNTFSSLPMGPSNDKIKIRNTVVRAAGTYFFPANTDSDGTLIYASGEELVLENGAPVIGATAGIDAGDAGLENPYFGELDLAGNPRVMNGAVDIGAIEADWRGVYARRLGGGTALRVTAASPAVTVRAGEGCVIVPDGSLQVALSPRPGSGKTQHEAKVSVSGGGVLTVTADGNVVGTVTAADGVCKVVYLSGSAPVFEFVFAPEGGGEAKIFSVRSRSTAGTTLLIR